jgi:calcium-dependent protein kinase
MVDEVIDKIDVNKSGQVDFTEFVVATINQNALLKKEKIAQAFQMFDQDGNGFIDKKELKAVMGGINLTDEEWDLLIAEYDTDKDGMVSVFN